MLLNTPPPSSPFLASIPRNPHTNTKKKWNSSTSPEERPHPHLTTLVLDLGLQLSWNASKFWYTVKEAQTVSSHSYLLKLVVSSV